MAIKVARNLASAGHTVHSIDHGQIEQYEESGAFASCHLWQWIDTPEAELEKQFRETVLRHKIELVIVAQKLFLYSNVAEKICRELNIKVVFTEYFFDDKLIFDDVGLQYTKDNQAKRECDLPIDWPKNDREPQPENSTIADVLSKHRINYGTLIGLQAVVIYGQVLWDMSLVESPERMSYDEYIDGLCCSNPETLFFFKPHPKDVWCSPNSTRYSYPNLIRVNESLRTLFQFPAHTAYSSTVIFEGVSRGLQFASAGYHLMQGHTHLIVRGGFNDIYNKIISYSPDMHKVTQRASYLTNVYALSMSDPLLPGRLIHGIDYVLEKKAAR